MRLVINPLVFDDVSRHALHTWRETCDEREQLYTWIHRVTLEALRHGTKIEKAEVIKYLDLYFILYRDDNHYKLNALASVGKAYTYDQYFLNHPIQSKEASPCK